MASCKDCLHVDVCEDITRHKLSPSRVAEILPILREHGKTCELFKDRSRFVEVPCKVGDAEPVIDSKFASAYDNGHDIKRYHDIEIPTPHGRLIDIDYNFSIRATTVNGFKMYTVNLNSLHDLIKEKVNEFFSHYNCEPKYVKVPSWLVVILKRFADHPACFTISDVGNKYKPDTLFGLEICETVAIERVGDIEVF